MLEVLAACALCVFLRRIFVWWFAQPAVDEIGKSKKNSSRKARRNAERKAVADGNTTEEDGLTVTTAQINSSKSI